MSAETNETGVTITTELVVGLGDVCLITIVDRNHRMTYQSFAPLWMHQPEADSIPATVIEMVQPGAPIEADLTPPLELSA